jgi:hypothetical protein
MRFAGLSQAFQPLSALLAVALVWSLPPSAVDACGRYGYDLPISARLAVDGCSRSRPSALEQLRAAGPEGLEALFTLADEHATALAAADTVDPQAETNWQQRLTQAIDAVGGQRDCRSSRLFWHTDLAAAVEAARQSGKPILSLRLLGNLTDELSCANSRFFRTTLYANEDVSRVLRERFVLHWQSVRPVPKVTIDFGDGRTLERTLTGNSIHYVLDQHGRLIDALPGLYGPAAFLRALEQDESVALSLAGMSDADAVEPLAAWHMTRQAQIAAAWRADLDAVAAMQTGNYEVGQAAPAPNADPLASRDPAPNPPRAREAAEVAVGKGAVEVNLIAAISPEELAALQSTTDDATWAAIAALHADDARLDAASINLMRAKHPDAALAGRRAMTKRIVEDPLLRVVANFQASIALDTVRNEYLLHRQIHEWLAAAPLTPDLAAFNERVYAELFLTPSSDPWLGLVPADTYTALENDGVVTRE